MVPFSTTVLTPNMGYGPLLLEIWRISTYYCDFCVLSSGVVNGIGPLITLVAKTHLTVLARSLLCP